MTTATGHPKTRIFAGRRSYQKETVSAEKEGASSRCRKRRMSFENVSLFLEEM